MLLRTLFACCLLASASARAEDAAVQAAYAGYAKGLNLFDIDLAVTLRPADYRLRVAFRLVGVLGALVHADGATVVDGRFAGGGALPRELFSSGQFRGAPHVTQIDWRDGSPKVTQMLPVETDRESVPDSEQAHTIDALSAIALVLHRVNETGTCEAAARTFDGVRLAEFAARTAGTETLAPTGRSSFQGQALRCDVTGRMTGGFMRDGDQTELRRPKQGSAWFARLQPGQPLIPVRIVFYTEEGSPSATLYLAPPH